MPRAPEIIAPITIEIDTTKGSYYRYLHTPVQNESTLIPNPARFYEDTNYIACTEFVEMDSEIYDEILSFDSVADTGTFAQRCSQKGLIFSFFTDSFPFYDDTEVGITVDNDYHRQLIFRKITQFRTTLTIYDAIKAALANPESYELVFRAFDLAERNKMGILFDPCDPETANDRIIVAFCNKLNQFVALSEFQVEDYQFEREHQSNQTITKETAIDELLNETEDGEFHYTTMALFAHIFTTRYINKYIEPIEPRQNIEKDGLSLLCPTVLSAMYQMLLLCPFNNIKYQKCANNKCNRFFRVDSHHPQTLCKFHMETRQRKRQNYTEKKKREIIRRPSSN